MADIELTARVLSSVSEIAAEEWDGLAGDNNPFVSHAFLSILEMSGSVGPGTGWTPAPLVLDDGNGRCLAVMPSYLKSHSQGEYVFDYAWADAWHRAGGHYYPKLQICVPFTPATGPRLLLADNAFAAPLLGAAERLATSNGWSSVHATFVDLEQIALFEEAGWLPRHDIQFHWRNEGFADFEAFLATLTSRKRKELRKERAKANEDIQIEALSGSDIKAAHWDAFWLFYQDTGARKWGSPYLTREAFALIGEHMAERVLLILAFEDGKPIAGALNFIGGEAIYGRYWGCLVEKPFLHFELCYYRAIDAAIERGLKRVEAGAQGGHKLARGYAPVTTTSMHYIADPRFREAVAAFLERERQGVAMDRSFLADRLPFRRA